MGVGCARAGGKGWVWMEADGWPHGCDGAGLSGRLGRWVGGELLG